MRLDALQRRWNQAGQEDPFWAVLGAPDKKGNRWQIEEFFKTGVEEIRSLMEYVDSLHMPIRGSRALDFGCGPGRLTQPLGEYFESVDGVDISPSMIALANQSNRNPDRCHFHVNGTNDLRLFEDRTFDFIYTTMTLQHIKPRHAKVYLAELIRVLAAGGLMVFQLPTRPATLSGRLKATLPEPLLNLVRLLRYGNHPGFAMYGMPPEAVAELCQRNGATVIDVTEQPPDERWQSVRYAVRLDRAG
jgi:SAM-dependent methyltransferase